MPPRARATGAFRNPRSSTPRRVRRIVFAAATICLISVVISYVEMLGQPSNSSLGIRTVEWLRDNGARAIVNQIESTYYSLTAPATGGPALKALPHQAGTALTTTSGQRAATTPGQAATPVQYYRPAPIKPLAHAALPGEGVWHAPVLGSDAHPPVLTTSFRSDPVSYPQMVAGVAWIDHTLTSTQIYPGLQEPAVALPSRGPEEVPRQLRSRLVATFNSGFKLQDSGGGLTLGGHTYAPLKDGLATIVRFRSGRVNVESWSSGPAAPPDVVYARQNLPLIVENGKPNPNLSDGPEWGATLGNAVRVWRSAVGIDRYGNLIYGAADYQTVGSLATIMIRAGAVRAMELDINSYWPSFITYTGPGAKGPTNLLPNMVRSPERYLTPDDRDFFAVFLR
jgi:hypothetical protein